MNADVICRFEGRLGNNMFQAANVIAYGNRHNRPWAVSSKSPNSQEIYRFSLPVVEDSPSRIQWQEPSFSYVEIPTFCPALKVTLKGFFQSYKYFDDHTYEVRNAFKLPMVEPIRKVSIHVRRTDLIGNLSYHPLPMDYYEKATRTLMDMSQRDFLVFSDDIQWCRENLCGCNTQASFEFCYEEDPIVAMAKMAACEHHIIANSTFSWWAAWLDEKSKLVICPRDEIFWAEGMQGDPPKDLIPPDWMKI